MEAVVSFLIPLEVEDEQRGTSTMYDVIVVQGSNHKEAQIISVQEKKIHSQLSFDPVLAQNGTLHEALTNFHRYMQSNQMM